MDLYTSFRNHLDASTAASGYWPSFLPEVLTRIAVTLLGVDGASLSLLSDELRMPLAASDEQARSSGDAAIHPR